MKYLAVHEWGSVAVGDGPNSFTRGETNSLIAAARSHRLGGEDGTSIVSDHYRFIRAHQCVGVLATGNSSLEIFPKVDPVARDPETKSVRGQLVRMLGVAMDLGLSDGEVTLLARQSSSLLDILIRIFAKRLLEQAHQGLPRSYQQRKDDLPALRGRLDVMRQFTIHSVRPDRLACRFDELSIDTPLMRIMRACVIFLFSRAHTQETLRLLSELRLVMDGVSDVPIDSLPWNSVKIDRSNNRWRTLYNLARLFLLRDWQATHYDAKNGGDGISLLFPMNDLFEATVAAVLRRALAPYGFDVVVQGGFRYCLGIWNPRGSCTGTLFRTRPDIVIRRSGRVVAIVDAKWKCLRDVNDDNKRGMSQADIYQLMAYAQIYSCNRLFLLYPHHAGLAEAGVQATYGIVVQGKSVPDQLQVLTVDVSREIADMVKALRPILLGAIGGEKTTQSSAA